MNSQMIEEFNDLTKGRQYSQMNADTLGELYKRVEGMKKLLSDMHDAVCLSEYQILSRLNALKAETPYKQTISRISERKVDLSGVYADGDIRKTISGMIVTESPYADYVIENLLRTEKEVYDFVDRYNGFWGWVENKTGIGEVNVPTHLDSETVAGLIKTETSEALYKTGQFEGQPKLNVGTSLDEKRGTMTARNNYVAVYGIQNLRL